LPSLDFASGGGLPCFKTRSCMAGCLEWRDQALRMYYKEISLQNHVHVKLPPPMEVAGEKAPSQRPGRAGPLPRPQGGGRREIIRGRKMELPFEGMEEETQLPPQIFGTLSTLNREGATLGGTTALDHHPLPPALSLPPPALPALPATFTYHFLPLPYHTCHIPCTHTHTLHTTHPIPSGRFGSSSAGRFMELSPMGILLLLESSSGRRRASQAQLGGLPAASGTEEVSARWDCHPHLTPPKPTADHRTWVYHWTCIGHHHTDSCSMLDQVLVWRQMATFQT